MKKLRKCERCLSYTLKEICPFCGKETIIFKTLKYSPEDPYQKYRLEKRRSEFIQ